jgi:hypothetical protein
VEGPCKWIDAKSPWLRICQSTSRLTSALAAALDGNDSAAAYRAIWTLVAAPAQCVPLLKEHLQPVAPVDAKRLAGLIAALDDDAFDVREKASTELEKLGEAAEGALRKALEGQPSPEVRQRVKLLLEKAAGAGAIGGSIAGRGTRICSRMMTFAGSSGGKLSWVSRASRLAASCVSSGLFARRYSAFALRSYMSGRKRDPMGVTTSRIQAHVSHREGVMPFHLLSNRIGPA